MKRMNVQNKIHKLYLAIMAVMLMFGTFAVLRPAVTVDAATQTPQITSSVHNAYVGRTLKLKAKYGSKNITTARAAVWKSSNSSVASIGKHTGKITAKKAGTVYITVTYKNMTSTRYQVTVKKATYMGKSKYAEYQVDVLAKKGKKITVEMSWWTMRAALYTKKKTVTLKNGVASFKAPVYGGGGAKGQSTKFKLTFKKKTVTIKTTAFKQKLTLKK